MEIAYGKRPLLVSEPPMILVSAGDSFLSIPPANKVAWLPRKDPADADDNDRAMIVRDRFMMEVSTR
jgi:hypothetical protein